MESNINHASIVEYSKTFASKILQSFFTPGKSFANGEELKNFTEIRQLNYFIVKGLFSSWKAETGKLKSPFFDYDNEEVQEALKEFMNVLSAHIQVERNTLRPLLEEAVRKTILLIFSPYEFYLQEINNPEFSRMSIQDLHDLQKYIKTNRHLLDIYIKKFEDEGIEAVFNDDAVRMFNEVCEKIKETPDDFEPFLKQFSEIHPLAEETIYGGEDQQQIDFETSESSPDKEKAEQQSHEVNEQYKKEQKILLDTLGAEKRETLADIHQKQPSDGIKKNITLNQRFMFLNELFQGNMDEFEMVINALENCQNRKEALDFIQGNYFEKNAWDQDKEEVQELMEIIYRRFPE